MIGRIDNSRNIFLYINSEEIKEIPKGLEGKIIKYHPKRRIIPILINSNGEYASSVNWKYLENQKNEIEISLGKYLYETLSETGNAYSRVYASAGEEVFIKNLSDLDTIEKMDLEKIEWEMEH